MNKLILTVKSKFQPNKLFTVGIWGGLSTIVKMIAGFVAIKIMSREIGPKGIAVTGQFLNIIAIITLLSTGGINQGVTAIVASHFNERQKQLQYVKLSLLVCTVSSLIIFIGLTLLSSHISEWIFKTDSYRVEIIILGGFTIFISLSTILLNILNGFKRYKSFVAVNIISTLFSLALTIFLVLNYQVKGAVTSYIAGYAVIFLTAIFFFKWQELKDFLHVKLESRNALLRNLSKFTIMTLISTITLPLGQMIIRQWLIQDISLNFAGIWEGLIRLSNMYLTIITSAIGLYYLPRISELKNPKDVKHEVLQTYKAIFPLLIAGFLIIFFLRDFIVKLIFTGEFLPMTDLIPFQLISDLLKVASWLLAYIFWAKSITTPKKQTQIITLAILLRTVKIFIGFFGGSGVVYAYVFTNTVYFLGLLTLFAKTYFK